eukprot:4521682-Pleurochrysis_carterae.AAC.1
MRPEGPFQEDGGAGPAAAPSACSRARPHPALQAPNAPALPQQRTKEAVVVRLTLPPAFS